MEVLCVGRNMINNVRPWPPELVWRYRCYLAVRHGRK
jgi:hypothetical protein